MCFCFRAYLAESESQNFVWLKGVFILTMICSDKITVSHSLSIRAGSFCQHGWRCRHFSHLWFVFKIYSQFHTPSSIVYQRPAVLHPSAMTICHCKKVSKRKFKLLGCIRTLKEMSFHISLLWDAVRSISASWPWRRASPICANPALSKQTKLWMFKPHPGMS